MAGAQIGQMMLGIVDTWMVGRLGPTMLASAALGDTWVFGTIMFAFGILAAMDPIVSQAHGARRGDEAARALQRGSVLALLLSPLLFLLWMGTERVLLVARQPGDLAAHAATYVGAQAWSIPPMLLFAALKSYLQARGIVLAPLYVTIAANFVNVGLNQWLIFGGFGVAPLGLRGAAIATGLTRTFMFLALLALVALRGWHRGAWVPWSRASFAPSGLARLLRYGVPLAFQISLEGWAFQIALLLVGRFGEAPLAAHSIVIRVASLSFMVPLGISIAASTRVGNLLGAGDRPAAQRSAYVALALGAGVMTVSAALFLLFREAIPRIFTADAAVVALAATIFPVAAAFQLFDGTQAVGCGVLRGMGDPVPAMLYNLVGYYLIGLPLGWFLGVRLGWGTAGVWWGLLLALAVVAGLLVLRIARRGPATVRRLAIGGGPA